MLSGLYCQRHYINLEIRLRFRLFPLQLPVASSNTAAEGGTCSASVPGQGPRCCARFDYDGEDPADLAFAAGDIIRLVERVGNEWMKGELNGRVGMFPVGFVEVIEDIPPGLESTNAVQGVSGTLPVL